MDNQRGSGPHRTTIRVLAVGYKRPLGYTFPTPRHPHTPVRADAQALGQQATQQLAVGAILRAAYLADAMQAAERAGLGRAGEGHELVRDHVHCDVLGGGARSARRSHPATPQSVHFGLEPPSSRLPPAPQLRSTSSGGHPLSHLLPANLGGLASGLRQLLGELGEEPVRHGGAGHVGVQDEHRHVGGEAERRRDESGSTNHTLCRGGGT